MAAAIALIAIAWTAWHFLVGRWSEETEDAYVQGNVVTVTPQTGGTVVVIGAEDGQKVVAGQVLVRFDAADADAAYAQAEAGLANAVRQAQATLASAQADVSRRSGLVASGAVSAEELAHARTQLASAQATLASAQAAVSGASENV